MTQFAFRTGHVRLSVNVQTGQQWEQAVPLDWSRSTSPWMSGCFTKIIAFGRMAGGWDGGTSPPATGDAIFVAGRVLVAVAQVEDLPEPHLAPVPGGGVQFEWSLGDRGLELEVLPNGDLLCLQIDGDSVREIQVRLNKWEAAVENARWLLS